MRRHPFATHPHLLLAGVLVVSVAVGACAPARPNVPPTAAPVTDLVRIAWADVGTPTPFRVSTLGPGGAVLLTLIYDTLTWKDQQGVIPWLAERWDVSADGRTYAFTLAPGVTWHDGQPLTADDVAFSFDYYAQHPYRWTSTAMVQQAEVVAPNQVRLTLAEPYAPFLDEVAGSAPIIPKHVWASVPDPFTYDGSDATIGSGPYRLAEYRSAEGAYRLLANPAYFKGAPNVREIQQLNTAPETRVQAVQQGQLELALSADASVSSVLPADSRVKVFETAPLSTVRLAFNTARAPLDQPAVRQAIAYAIDRSRIAEVVTKGPPIAGSAGVIPPETHWFAPGLPAYDVDPARARALLGGQSPTLELLADPTSREPELLQPMLEAVGIHLVVKRADASTRTQLLREGSFQVALLSHIGVGGDPDYLRRWYSGQETNDFAQGSIFHDADFERLARAQASTTDVSARQEMVAQMQRILADQLPTLTLYYRRFYWVYDSTRFTPMNTCGGLMNGIPFVTNKLAFLP
jgi:peptide/nickel transport system substrate-binding protein